jgi:hypothetical protein
LSNLREKYQFTESSEEISIKPGWGRRNWVWGTGLLAVIAISIILSGLFEPAETANIICYTFAVTCSLSSLYDMIFQIHTKIIFHKPSQNVYRKRPFRRKEKLMTFGEIEIIRKSENGVWEYAIGKKKKQFLKNYAISLSFTNSEKGRIEKDTYEQGVLEPIFKLTSNDSR